jgi:hypothetical protein
MKTMGGRYHLFVSGLPAAVIFASAYLSYSLP